MYGYKFKAGERYNAERDTKTTVRVITNDDVVHFSIYHDMIDIIEIQDNSYESVH